MGTATPRPIYLDSNNPSIHLIWEDTMSQDPLSDQGLDIGIDSMLRDEPGYRVGFTVEAFNNNQMEMVLRTDDRIRWWKSLSYFVSLQNGHGLGPELRIETKDDVHEARQVLLGPALTSQGVFELWKGGGLGFGAFAGSLPINAWANRGRRLIMTWHQD
jgi:hypothetical protein